MATLTLKNVPEELVERLKLEAKQNRRSLNQETLARLERSLGRRAPEEVDATIAALEQLHRRMAHLPPLDDERIDRAKRSGRL
jgi:plasmid stability protein